MEKKKNYLLIAAFLTLITSNAQSMGLFFKIYIDTDISIDYLKIKTIQKFESPTSTFYNALDEKNIRLVSACQTQSGYTVTTDDKWVIGDKAIVIFNTFQEMYQKQIQKRRRQ